MSANAQSRLGYSGEYPASPVDYVRQAKRDLPEDRKGYILAQLALGSRGKFEFGDTAIEALRVLHQSHEAGTLQPPLNDELAHRISEVISRFNIGACALDSPITTFLLASAVDQGSRPGV